MRKRQFIKFFFSVLLCLVMLAACGNDSSSKGSEKNEDEEEITEGSFVGTWGEDDDEHLTLDEDGEGVFHLWGEDNDIKWEFNKQKKTVSFELDDEEYTCKLSKDGKKLTLKSDAGDINIKLEKQKTSKKKKSSDKKKDEDIKEKEDDIVKKPQDEEDVPVDIPPVDADRNGNTIRVGIVTRPAAESGYRERNCEDLERVFGNPDRYETIYYESFRLDEQISAAKKCITEGVDYLLLCSPDDDPSWLDVLYDAQESGIRVILFDTFMDVNPHLCSAFVCSDMENQGQLAVDWLLAQNLAEYNVIHLQGAMGSAAQIGRSGALKKQFASGKMNKVAQETATWDEAEAKKIVENVISSGKSFNVIYAENDGMAKGAVAALDEHGISHGIGGDVLIVSFDCNRWALQEVYNGNWNVDIQCSPFMADDIDAAIQQLERGELFMDRHVYVEDRVFDAATITSDMIEKYGL